MSNFDDASLNQPPDVNVVPPADTLNNRPSLEAHSDAFPEASEQIIVVDMAMNDDSHTKVAARPSNDLSEKILKQAEKYEKMLNRFLSLSRIPTLSNEIRSVQGFGSLYNGICAPQGLGSLSIFPDASSTLEALTLVKPTLLQLNIPSQITASPIAQIDSLIGIQPWPILSKNLVNTDALSVMKNWSVLSSPAFSAMISFQQSLTSSLGGLLPDLDLPFKYLDLLNSSWLPSVKLWDQFQSVNSLFPSLGWMIDLTNSINATIGIMPDFFKRLREDLKQRILSAFKRIGFCLAPSMSEDLMYWVLDQVEAGNSNIVAARLCNDYARNGYAKLRQTVERWLDNPEFARRWRFIWPAFKHHTNKDYASSMRVLAPDIEGVAKQVLIQNAPLKSSEGRMGRTNLSSPKLTILGALNEVVDKTHINSPATDIVSWVRFKSTIEFVENEFVKKIDFNAYYSDIRSGKYPRNRHGNLHGMQLEGYSASNSLRLFMMLDAMYDLFQNYMLNGGVM